MEIKASIIKVDSAIPSLKAIATITIDNCFVVKNIRLIEGKNGLFFAMPSYKTNNGEYKDICFPINKEARQQISDAIFKAYNGEDEERKAIQEEESAKFDENLDLPF